MFTNPIKRIHKNNHAASDQRQPWQNPVWRNGFLAPHFNIESYRREKESETNPSISSLTNSHTWRKQHYHLNLYHTIWERKRPKHILTIESETEAPILTLYPVSLTYKITLWCTPEKYRTHLSFTCKEPHFNNPNKITNMTVQC